MSVYSCDGVGNLRKDPIKYIQNAQHSLEFLVPAVFNEACMKPKEEGTVIIALWSVLEERTLQDSVIKFKYKMYFIAKII